MSVELVCYTVSSLGGVVASRRCAAAKGSGVVSSAKLAQGKKEKGVIAAAVDQVFTIVVPHTKGGEGQGQRDPPSQFVAYQHSSAETTAFLRLH